MDPNAVTIGLGALAALALLFAARLWWREAARRWAFARRRARGREGEVEAEAILRQHGYRILERQIRGRARYLVDGEPRDAEVIADLLVSRGRRRLVAEVKTGAKAPDAMYRATRRQLLEYAHAFDVDGLLLVDADRRTVRSFEVPRRSPARTGWLWLGFGVIVGCAVATLLP